MEPGTTFAKWLTVIVHRDELVVAAAGPRERVGTWSERLGVAMGADNEYDSYLRQIANGKRFAGEKVTYKIGCGLRAAGLMWCSGALALMRNPRTYHDALALIDIASRFEMNLAEAWLFFAGESATIEMQQRPLDEYGTAILAGLANHTQLLQPTMDHAFAEFQKRKSKTATGLLGIAHRIASDKTFGPRADDVVALILEKWGSENRQNHKRLLDDPTRRKVDSGWPIAITDAPEEKA